MARNPIWIATRKGQDWRDEETLAAIEWFVSTVPSQEWSARMDRVRATFEPARDLWPTGAKPALFDPKDLIAWYIFQANAYAADRPNAVEHEVYRIAPVFRRVGQLLPVLKRVVGSEDRVARMMRNNTDAPDDALYELLVAGAYGSRGWGNIRFVPEDARQKTPDLHVSKGRSHWAVECTRTGRSDYLAHEREVGNRVAETGLQEAERRGVSIAVEVIYEAELISIEEAYLAGKVSDFLAGGPEEWADEVSRGRIERADLRPLRALLAYDDIIFGASRMIELLMGEYFDAIDYRMAGQWTPAPGRIFHATAVQRASVVGWISASEEAARRKAIHFRALVSDKSRQLTDRPGVLHVGYETRGGNSADGLRHRLNVEQIQSFDPRGSTLEWVYGNYMTPEHTTARMESAALSETTAIYPIKGRRHRRPIPDHMLFIDDEGAPGSHWHR